MPETGCAMKLNSLEFILVNHALRAVSPWPAPPLFDHPQATQFYGREFRIEMERAGLRIQRWRQVGNWMVAGRAIRPSQQGK